MAKNPYTHRFTPTSLRIIESLEKQDYKVRDVINAGIVLFDQADFAQRGQAQGIAYAILKTEITSTVKKLRETIAWMRSIKQPEAFSPEERKLAAAVEQSLRFIDESGIDPTAAADAIVDGAEDEVAGPRKKQSRRGPGVKPA